MKADKNLWVLVFVCVINSLGFGIIVPVLYTYGKTFGLTGATLGILTASFSVAQFFGGTSLLIMVGVMLDTMRQMESHLLMRHYDGFLKKGRLKGRF